eukprot:6990646-Prymnesium_polylepis.1
MNVDRGAHATSSGQPSPPASVCARARARAGRRTAVCVAPWVLLGPPARGGYAFTPIVVCMFRCERVLVRRSFV